MIYEVPQVIGRIKDREIRRCKLKNRKVLNLVGINCLIVIVMVLFMTGCAKPAKPPSAPTTPLAPSAAPAAPTEPLYTVLDPRSSEPEVEYQGLSPRLDNLEGKKVGIINMGGAGAEIMETIGPDLEAAVPGCTAVYLEAGHDPAAMGGVSELIKSCDAIILGHNY